MWKIVLTMIVLFFAAFTAIGSAAAIYVPDDYGTIQGAVDAATAGDTIIVRDGTYTENVNVNKPLTIRSENGSTSTTVQASNSNDDVFEITADYVNILGFTATGATGSLKAGIYLNNEDYCKIYGNNCSNNYLGIRVYSSSNNNLASNTASNNHGGIKLYSSSNNNMLTSNTASNNYDIGIYLYSSSYNNLIGNTASNNNNFGIYLYSSSNNNMLTNNTASNNNNFGIYLYSSSSNLIYNNYFNNTNNAQDDGTNIWNIAPTSGMNIIGGPYLGGNYWSDYSGKDLDGDGLGDTLLPYNSSGDIQQGGDCHPLVERPDLVITDTWVYSDNCTICYNVTNIGNRTAPSCHNTTLYIDGVEVAHDHVPVDLTPGESYTGCFNGYEWTYTPPSDNITVCADNNETVAELDETNNCLTNIWTCGDVNGDGKVTMSDVRKVFNRYLDPNYPLDLPWAADVNCDGKVTMSDVRKVFNRYLDPGYELDCCCES